ncbi:TIGR04282 family arsenosugar biosynthesis glycosyltransferase [Halovulum sp. GXIMD14793]
MPPDTLIIMVKEPRPGRVKTRLAADIGTVPAAWWYRHQTTALIRRLGRDPRWRTVLAVAPDTEGLASRIWPADLARLPQGRGDLGDRMRRVMAACRPGRVVLIGSDIPSIRPCHITRAFAAFGRAEAVLGPAPDGGYWLIGSRHTLPSEAFRDVRWSGPHAQADTLRSLGGLHVRLTDELSDVDQADDLLQMKGGS